MFLQQSPNLQKDLNETAATLRTQLAPRISELKEEIAKLYAARFTEAELKELLTFFKSPLGKKLLQEEPRFVEGLADASRRMGQSSVRRSDGEIPRRNEEEGPQSLRASFRSRDRSEMADREVDLFVIGAGSGGVRAARICRRLRRQGAGRGRIPGRRHLRHSRLRAEEAPRLCVAFCRGIRGRRRLRLDRAGAEHSAGRR